MSETLADTPAEERNSAFLKSWVIREACLKAEGKGVWTERADARQVDAQAFRPAAALHRRSSAGSGMAALHLRDEGLANRRSPRIAWFLAAAAYTITVTNFAPMVSQALIRIPSVVPGFGRRRLRT